ncbi:alpha-N-acetylneuraminide alpha-2,8-sialyltransferase-like isoform X1 [Pygocentrus nattereri]|uniref:alpha-N-acetylneuraminide alpha-2,8-sialyltransferase-like isoform X1 n=1 Tax=Pygocentrus nattereri TaxID=42514 RepID=UPI001891A76C|nr:alpha-N-acetylneuraminide alpha-2,8-sialyltransferase-like isoform X1 [Pygocentrus nattereri]
MDSYWGRLLGTVQWTVTGDGYWNSFRGIYCGNCPLDGSCTQILMALWSIVRQFPKSPKALLTVGSLLTAYIMMIPLFSELHPANQTQEFYHKVRCSRLQAKISNMSTTKKMDMQAFCVALDDLFTCSVKPNITLRETYRVQLRSCCNASGSLFLTQKNSEVNQSVPYETRPNVKYKLTPDVYSKLPQDMPWRGRSLDRCAVVGSSGILLNSSCGREINSADFVIRFNMAPVNSSDVGVKCDLMNINLSQISREFSDFMRNDSRLRRKLDGYTNTTFMIAAFAYTFCTKQSVNLLQAMWPERHLLFLSPTYLRTLDQFWRRRGLRAPRLSTGFMLISSALELCHNVHVYGFWPFGTDLHQRPVNYHYYDKIQANHAFHAMPEEFLRLLQLHSQGALTLHLQPCT